MCNNEIIIYIFDKKILDITLEQLIIKILEDLKKYYNHDLKKSYNIKIYTNKYYGIILEINEFGNNCENDIINIDVKILKNTLFLYEVNDPLDYLDNEVYFYNNNFFINIKQENISLMENSNIIYGEEVYKIIGKGIKI